jgi:hypothetical protein
MDDLASRALNDYQAARAVFDLNEQASRGRFDLSEIDAVELDALGALIQSELEDRRRHGSPALPEGPEPTRPEPEEI